MNLLQKFEAAQLEKLATTIPDFAPGDTVRVNVKVVEGTRERIQAYEGVCIGEGVERVFPLYSPRLDSVVVVRRGDVRRAKLYYLRSRRGKSARITEKTTYGTVADKTSVA